MAIPSPLLTTALTVGATTHTLAKAEDGVYFATVNGVMMKVALKAANPMARSQQVSISLKHDPTLLDAYPDHGSGKASCFASMSFTPGTIYTTTAAIALLKEFASLLSQDAVVTALVNGSYA